MGQQAAGDVDRGPGSEHDGIAGRHRHCAATGRELRDVALDDRQVSGEITKGRADPGSSGIHPGLPQVDNQRNPAQSRIALQGRIRQLGTAHLHHKEVLGQRDETVDRAADVDDGAFIEINLPPLREKLLAAGGEMLA